MNPTGTWPTPGDLADPWADESSVRSGYPDYWNAGGTLDKDAYVALEERFRAALADARAGRFSSASLPELAAQLLLDVAPTSEPLRRAQPHPAIPTHEELGRVATDLCPAAAGEALDRYLGPLADELDLRNPGHLLTARNAIAAFCFSRPDGAARSDGDSSVHGRSPFQTWCRRKPLPSVEDRARLRHVARTPMALWSLEAREGDRWRVADRTGLPAECLPTGPVHFPELASPWRDPRPTDAAIARIFEGPDGWVGLCSFAFPGIPPERRVQTWLTLTLWEKRLLDRRLTLEALLRTHPETLCRRMFEWAWLHGDEDPYRDAALYDLEYTGHDEDIAWYVSLAASTPGPILELGCGTGRLTLPLAESGRDVDGIDLSPSMLDGLSRRLVRRPDLDLRIRTWRGDFRSLQPDRRYPLVIWPFNALHHCRSREEIHQVLAGIDRALEPDGLLAVDCYLPAPQLYDRDPAERIEPRTFAHPETGEPLESWEQGWWDAERQIHHVVYAYRRPDGSTTHTHLQLRMHTLDELRAIFRDAGWRIASEAKDFRGTPLDDDALKWVGVLTRT